MWAVLGFIVVYVVASVWDVVRVNGVFEKFVNAGRKSDARAHQPEWLVRRLEVLAAEARSSRKD